MTTRPARRGDARSIARIYNQGIAERLATFETRPRSADEVAAWTETAHPMLVVEDEARVVGFAASFPYRPARACYDGIAEFSVYVDRDARRRGVGRLAMEALIATCERNGFWKLVSRVFPENVASRGLLARLGFREVGTYRRHARLDGAWRDVVIVERLIGAAADAAAGGQDEAVSSPS